MKLDFLIERYIEVIPAEIVQFFTCIRMTNINDFPMPDYDIFKKLFRTLMAKNGSSEKTFVFPWVKILNDNKN